jgi:hypothetical protein
VIQAARLALCEHLVYQAFVVRKDMSLEDFGQRAIEFVRVHEMWTALIVFTLAFVESLAFVSLLLPSWAALVGIGRRSDVDENDGVFHAVRDRNILNSFSR